MSVLMKKDGGFTQNLRRFKQTVNQNLGRAEKTSVLSDDLQVAEKKLEMFSKVLNNLVKRIIQSHHASGVQEKEKRMKKMPYAQLEVCLNDSAENMGEGSLRGLFLQAANNVHALSNEQQSMELDVETNIISYFQHITEEEIPRIRKIRQTLTGLILDYDTIKSRLHTVQKQSSDQSKIDSMKNELYDADTKVQHCKDDYASAVLTFIGKEGEISQKIIEWMEFQSEYHKRCHEAITAMLPEMSCTKLNSPTPVYGIALEDHLTSSNREIALVIDVCISILVHYGMEEEGIFRLAGSASKLKMFKAALNHGRIDDMEEYYNDLHVVAGALKLYIRELPEPLLTFKLYQSFIEALAIKDRDERLKKIWSLINELPKSHYNNVRYLVKFLAVLASKSSVNKMTPSNIAIVFGPNLLYSQDQDDRANVVHSSIQNAVVETLVEFAEYFFPGDVTFTDITVIEAELHADLSAPATNTNYSDPPKMNTQLSITPVIVSPSQEDTPLLSPAAGSNHAPPLNKSTSSSISSLENISTTKSPQVPRRPKKNAPRPPAPSAAALLRAESVRNPSHHHAHPVEPPPPVPQSPIVKPELSPKPELSQKSDKRPNQPICSLVWASSDLLNIAASVQSPPVAEPKIQSGGTANYIDESPNQQVDPSQPSNQQQTITKPFIPGHSRAKSESIRPKNPPPIPQRYNSTVSKHPYQTPSMLKNSSSHNELDAMGVVDVDSPVQTEASNSEQTEVEQKLGRLNSVSDTTVL